jgi:hypothetical protein
MTSVMFSPTLAETDDFSLPHFFFLSQGLMQIEKTQEVGISPGFSVSMFVIQFKSFRS